MKEIDTVERVVLDFIIEGDKPFLKILRDQMLLACVVKREYTGVGFFSTFYVPECAPRLGDSVKFSISDVIGSAVNLRNGIGFILYIEHGSLHMFEAYTYDERLPEEIIDLKLEYSPPRT